MRCFLGFMVHLLVERVVDIMKSQNGYDKAP